VIGPIWVGLILERPEHLDASWGKEERTFVGHVVKMHDVLVSLNKCIGWKKKKRKKES